MTVAALAAGDQVLIVRKGGIGEKRFELPHPRFYLFPTYAHQRPELVSAAGARALRRPAGAARGARRGCRCRPTPSCTRPTRSPTPRPSRRSTASTSSRPPTPRSACKWRRKHPLWAAVLRVWALPEPPVLEDAAAYGGCVSWVELPGDDRRARRAPAGAGRRRRSPRPRARSRRPSRRPGSRADAGPRAGLPRAGVRLPRRPGRLHGGRLGGRARGGCRTRSSRPSAAASGRSAAAGRWSAATRPGPGTRRCRRADAAAIVERDLGGARSWTSSAATRLEGAA